MGEPAMATELMMVLLPIDRMIAVDQFLRTDTCNTLRKKRKVRSVRVWSVCVIRKDNRKSAYLIERRSSDSSNLAII